MTTYFPKSIRKINLIARVRAARAMLRMRTIRRILIEPKYPDTDTRRHELLLNFILIGTISFFLILALTITYNMHTYADRYVGIELSVFLGIISLYVGLLALSRTGFVQTSSIILIGTNIHRLDMGSELARNTTTHRSRHRHNKCTSRITIRTHNINCYDHRASNTWYT
jgi:hypothetical protein